MREVYVGNGRTIKVQEGATVKFYDTKKLGEYLKEYKELKVGMKEDWFFTARTIKSMHDLVTGLFGSDWATPTIMLPEGEKIECYKEIDRFQYGNIYEAGMSDGIERINIWIQDFYNRLGNIESYEKRKEASEKINSILKEYERPAELEKESEET